MKILKYFMFVMVTQALVFAASGSDEERCDKQPGGSRLEGVRSYTGPGRGPLPTDQPGGGDGKQYKINNNRPEFMSPFPTKPPKNDDDSLGINDALRQLDIRLSE